MSKYLFAGTVERKVVFERIPVLFREKWVRSLRSTKASFVAKIAYMST